MCILNQDIYKCLLPNLLEIQRVSFCWFLEKGLLQELENFSNIRDYLGELELSLSAKQYKIRRPKYSLAEAKRRDTTYGIRIYVIAKLDYLITTESKRGEVFLGDIPLMTNEGTFLVNGIERVIINQIVRSPGIYYKREASKQNTYIYTASLISNRGTWVKFEIDKDDLIYVKVDKAKKLSGYVFLKALGLTDAEILTSLEQPEYFQKTLQGCEVTNIEDAFLEVHNKLRPGEPATVKGGQQLLYSRFFDPKRYDLGYVGRHKINQKLNLTIDEDVRILIPQDVLAIINELINFRLTPTAEDDIDHLGNRRIRSVGELLQNQVRIGLNRLERIVRERMTICEQKYLRVNILINPKPLVSSIREFFGSNPLSQFMDQTNPLAEITHKRRLSVLGPGGITRDRAGFAVRDIHPSQYGRICPVETPEGPNAGLIGSLSTYGRINSYGFIETPFYQVQAGRVIKRNFPIYLNATEEDQYRLAAGDLLVSEKNYIQGSRIPVRYRQELITVEPEEVDYVAVSPIQVVSLAASLIPFLEHDDANRALMGSNMQRQSVPLLYSEAPLIGTGLEGQTARDSGMTVLSVHNGKVSKLSEGQIFIRDKSNNTIKYFLNKYQRSNQDTCINQVPLVCVNEKVFTGQVLADGASTQGGELAVGQNILIAYMPWEGYNYEDAFVVSERLIYDDLFTSIHIEKFEIEIRQTKLGMEEITRDLPNASETSIRHLDENGIVNIGAWVESGDVLVGKLTPKGESDYPPEGKLLRAIFGEKSRDIRNTSLKLPHGTSGRVLDVKIFSRSNRDDLPPGTNEIIKVYIAQTRKIQIGDKMAGRHGNKGIISKILPRHDMPFLPDGQPVDILLNPLGVPSRMNVGQIFECLLGLAAEQLNARFKVVPFDEMYGVEASRAFVNKKLLLASKRHSWLFSSDHPGKFILRDGLTGKNFDNPITVGNAYMLKLVHLVDDKIHARSTGPYSLVTQQPLGGRAQQGGQRLGEMEVWALEAFGAAYTLQELLTIKSDDMQGRNETLNSIVKGRPIPRPGTPESFKVLMRELQALCLDIAAYKVNLGHDTKLDDTEINLMEEFQETVNFQSSKNKTPPEEHYLNYQTQVDSKFFVDDKI
jgi:DNA-directed RNA polymerase subunit beta|tara:strand:- start:12602 stop:15931 length:3330 start_codon:yes stop_codon:yes gene_type:complete